MPEKLKVSPVESSVIILNEILGGRTPNHYSKEVAEALYRSWRDHYDPERPAVKPEVVLQDPQKAELLIDAINQMVASLSDREQMVIALRFGRADGLLRRRKEISHQWHTATEFITRIEERALVKLNQPTRMKYLDPLMDLTPLN